LFRMEPQAMERSQGSDEETGQYSSPWRVLARFFERSRDLWKAKYKELQARIKAIRTEVRDLRRSRDRWRAKAEALEQENKELRSQSQRQATQSPPAPSRQERPIVTQLSS
jgi:septal ring factor EnvC (AmiA/AmiB activator)